MRKITQLATTAFLNQTNFKSSNTEVRTDQGGAGLYLHGNQIASIDHGGTIEITSAGWQSVTTKDRLNALPRVSITQKNWKWYLNGKEWDGKWIRV